MAFQKVLNCINDVSDGNIICDEFVYYSKLDRLFFEKWVNFWNDKGIEDGNKIGILTSNNMIIIFNKYVHYFLRFEFKVM